MSYTIDDWKGANNVKPGFRDRKSVSSFAPRQYAEWIDGVSSPDLTYRYAAGSSSRCLDYNHPFWYAFQRQRRYTKQFRTIDVGSSLIIEKAELSDPGGVRLRRDWDASKGQYRHFDGVFAPTSFYLTAMQDIRNGKPVSMPADLGIGRASLRALGSTAIAKSLPDVPDFSLARFIGELRAGLPKIPLKELRKSERKVSALGSEYLNVQFGLLPTASDIAKLVHLAGNPELRRRVKHTVGQECRVRKTLANEVSVSKRDLSSSEMYTLPQSFVRGSSGTETITDSTKIWSSVSFQYFQANRLLTLLDDLDEQLGNYGSIPKLIDFWNLTAWSWFIDWFSNFNHVMTNLSYLGRDGLTLQRGYIMCTKERRVEAYQACTTRDNGTVYSKGVMTFSRKYRVPASPFGFGFTWTDFDPFQTSILAALGISKLRF
jgi:hypothetical protein